MCASSCSSSISRCSAGKPLSAPTGTNTTGRNQPTTAGASTSAETSNRTGRERPIRAPSFLSVSCHSGGARRTSIDRMRAATTQPPASRTQKIAAPANQAITTHGRNCGERRLATVVRKGSEERFGCDRWRPDWRPLATSAPKSPAERPSWLPVPRRPAGIAPAGPPCAPPPGRPHTEPQSPGPARGSGPASSRGVPPTPRRRVFAWRSRRASFPFGKGVQHAADFIQFLARGRLCRQGAHHQASGRTAESPFQQVARDLPLRLLLGDAGLVDLRSEALAANEQALFRHQLHLLQGGGVAVALAELVVDFPHGGRSQPPEDGKNVEFGGGRKCHGRLVAARRSHLQPPYDDLNRKSTIKIVTSERA